ncbi:MAG: thiol reductant ABC exporter subunit CydD [Siculibacillus sp.]|nr:thiol reductant ABC exporter subunit CydD [Siculibacillus sp.]
MTETPARSDVPELLRSLRRVARPATVGAVTAAAFHGLLAVAVAHLLAGAVDAVVFRGADVAAVAAPLLLLAGVALLRAGAAMASDRFAFAAGAAVRRDLFAHLFDHAVAAGPVRLATRPTGERAAVMIEAVAGAEPYWRQWLPSAARVTVVPLAVLAVVAPVDRLGFAILAASLPLLVWAMILVGKGAEVAHRRQWASLARLGGDLLDQIRGLGDLARLGASGRALASVHAAAVAFGRETMAVLRLAFLSALVLEFFATVSIAAIALAVGFRLMWGELDFATGFFVLLLAPEFYAPLRDLGVRRHARIESLTALGSIAEMLAEPVGAPSGTRRRNTEAPPALRFEGVRVVHADGRVALDHLDLEVAAGEHVAIVGASGAGKSTLFALVAGFVEPNHGRVLVDGVPLDELDRDLWLRNLVHLPQTPHLFEGTIADNVAMGRPPIGGDAEVAFAAVLRDAGADAFVGRLPEGRDTPVGERGVGLSGGEAQRLALARAFWTAGSLVLFDEPTSHLDAETERLVGEAIARLGVGRTVLTIAHRLATVATADRVVVLDRGRVVEAGRPADLAATDGHWARMLATAGEEGRA